MKRILLLVALVASFSLSSNAQSWKDMLGKAAEKLSDEKTGSEAGETLKNVVGSIVGQNTKVSADMLLGTWNYDGIACELVSDNALSNIGGSVVTSKIEDKLTGYVAKVGIKKGVTSVTFAEEGKCSVKIKNKEIPATYTVDSSKNEVVFSFLYGKLNLKASVAYEVSNVNVVFDADKLLEFIKKLSSSDAVSKSDSSTISTLSTISALLKGYDGMKLGLKLSK